MQVHLRDENWQKAKGPSLSALDPLDLSVGGTKSLRETLGGEL